MNTHEKIEQMCRDKERKHAETELIKLAKEDIRRFIEACVSKGFRLGMKVGFWAGLLVAFIIYFIVN